MPADALLDTNVLVYTYATGEPEKRGRALATLDRLVVDGRGKVSTQVLGELFRVITQRLRPPRTPAEAAEDVVALARAWPTLSVTPLVVLEAVRGARDHGLS